MPKKIYMSTNMDRILSSYVLKDSLAPAEVSAGSTQYVTLTSDNTTLLPNTGYILDGHPATLPDHAANLGSRIEVVNFAAVDSGQSVLITGTIYTNVGSTFSSYPVTTGEWSLVATPQGWELLVSSVDLSIKLTDAHNGQTLMAYGVHTITSTQAGNVFKLPAGMFGKVNIVLAYDSTFPITIEQNNTANPATIQSKHATVTSFSIGLYDQGKDFEILGTGARWESLYTPQGAQGASVAIYSDINASQFEDSDYLTVLPSGGDWAITVDDAIRFRTYANTSTTNTLSIKAPSGSLIIDIPPLTEGHAWRDRQGNYIGHVNQATAVEKTWADPSWFLPEYVAGTTNTFHLTVADSTDLKTISYDIQGATIVKMAWSSDLIFSDNAFYAPGAGESSVEKSESGFYNLVVIRSPTTIQILARDVSSSDGPFVRIKNVRVNGLPVKFVTGEQYVDLSIQSAIQADKSDTYRPELANRGFTQTSGTMPVVLNGKELNRIDFIVRDRRGPDAELEARIETFTLTLSEILGVALGSNLERKIITPGLYPIHSYWQYRNVNENLTFRLRDNHANTFDSYAQITSMIGYYE